MRHLILPALLALPLLASCEALAVGTLAGILSDVAGHLGLTRDELARRLFE